MRILFLTARLPYPPTRGDRLRAYHFLRMLSREHRISLLSFVADESESANLAHLRPYCADINLVHHSGWQSGFGAAIGAWRPLPLQALYFRSTVMQQAVNRLMHRHRFDVVYVHLFRMAQYITNKGKLPYRILDLTDAISQEIERSLPYRDPLWRLIYRLEMPRVKRYETELVKAFDETWVISDTEREALTGVGAQGNLQVVPNGVDSERYFPAFRRSGTPRLAFVGHMGIAHNVDAAEYLVRDILPLVRASVPQTEVDIIGAEPSERVRALTGVPGVRVLGHVPDLNDALNQAQVFVAPLRFAAGIQNKVLEAMAAGLPVVTTSSVNDGLRATVGRELLVADESTDFAEAVVTLLRDSVLREEMGRAGRAFVIHNFRWDDVLRRMKAIEGLIAAR